MKSVLVQKGLNVTSMDDSLIDEINQAVDDFNLLVQERHTAGQIEYGTFTFLGNDVVRMMLEELADTVNYATMQGIKLLILQKRLEADQIPLGIKAFKGTKDVGWKK